MSDIDVIARIGRRAELRRERRRRQRRFLLGGIAGIVVTPLLVVGTPVLRPRGSSSKTKTAKQPGPQSPMLSRVKGEGGAAAASPLPPHPPAGHTGAAVLIPP